MNVCIVSFSGRPDGNCSHIAELIRQKNPGATMYDFSAFSISPCGHCHYDCFQRRENCPYFSDPEFSLCEAITYSDLTYFIIPNYCDYPCANFYVFNERSQCYFQHHADLMNQYLAVRKKFIVVSNTGKENFTVAFSQHIPEASVPDVLFLSAKQFGKISIKGDLMDSQNARETVAQFADTI